MLLLDYYQLSNHSTLLLDIATGITGRLGARKMYELFIILLYSGKLWRALKFGESVIRMHWRILNLAIANAST